MGREEFINSLDARGNVEEIDGITVVHTGMSCEIDGSFGVEESEIVDMFDHNGNRFYTNCSQKDAEGIISKLKEGGKEAVIGHAAPLEVRYGEFVSNTGKEVVGIYLVKPKEEEKGKTEKDRSE